MLKMINNLIAELALLVWRLLRGLVWLVWAIFRPAVRFISAVLILAAVMMLTADYTRWQIGETEPTFHSLAHHIKSAAPATFDGFAKSVSALHPIFWDYGLGLFLATPAWLLFATFGLLIALAGREPKRVNVFIN